MATIKHNPNSVYRTIAWTQGVERARFYELGQEVTAHIHPNGDRSKAYVYSIDDTSEVIDNKHYIRRFTISLINSSGEFYNWFSIEQPVNITLQYSHENLTKI